MDSDRVVVRIQRTELEALDKYSGDMGRPEAIRRILREWLTDHGYIK